jgi:hypothetical protein
MRKLLILVLFAISMTAQAFGEYDSKVSNSVAHLGFTKSDIMVAIKYAMGAYRWKTENETENSVVGNLKGTGAAKVKAEISGDTVTISFLTKHDMQNYRYYKWLLNIQATMMVYLTDCKSKDLTSTSSIDPATRVRRNLIFAFYKYHWRISEFTESRIVASLTNRGRIEADYSANGLDKIRRWDDIDEAYTNPDEDGYVRRIKDLFERQQSSCAR